MSKKQLSYVIASIALILGVTFYFLGNFMLDIRHEQLSEDNKELFEDLKDIEPIRINEFENNSDPVFLKDDQKKLDEYDSIMSASNSMEKFILFVSLGLVIIAAFVFKKAYKSNKKS